MLHYFVGESCHGTSRQYQVHLITVITHKTTVAIIFLYFVRIRVSELIYMRRYILFSTFRYILTFEIYITHTLNPF